MTFIRKFKRGGRTYLAEVENRRVGGKVVQHFVRYVGKEADGRTVLSTSVSDIAVEEIKVYGPLLVLDHLATRIALKEHLGRYANEVLSMVYAHCLDYQSLNQMQRWFARTDLNMMLGMEGLTERRLVDAMNDLEQMDHQTLQRDIFASVRQRYQINDTGIIYDVTNTYLYGRKCPLGKLGHDKEGVKGRPLIQIGLGVTKDEGIAVFHKTFPGNIHDSRTLADLITDFRHYGLRPGTIVYDRGITSGSNIAELFSLKWDTVCGVALTTAMKKFWRPHLSEARRLSLGDRVQLNKTTFYVTTRPYTFQNVPGALHLCFNPQQQLTVCDARRAEVLEAQQHRRQRQTIKPGMEKFVDGRGNVQQQALAAAEEFDGYSCIFSTQSMTKSELVHGYFDKDLVEKAFRSLKGVVRLQPVRHWLARHVVAHVFICYLAYLLLSLLRHNLRPIGLSADEALLELDSMYKVYLRDRSDTLQLTRVVTLTKRQEQILRAVDRSLLNKCTVV